jgi:flagellar hook assembly protein FlgD
MSTAVDHLSSVKPVTFEVFPNYPNPFNSETVLKYRLTEPAHVSIFIFDVRGKLLRKFFVGKRSPGNHSLIWDGRMQNGNVASSGNYIARFQSEFGIRSIAMQLLK